MFRLLILAVLLTTRMVRAVPGTYNVDCSANERLRCHVGEDVCASNPESDDYPSAPYDLRVSPFIMANPTNNPGAYQLLVNVSWMPTHQSNINKTIGFEMTIVDKDTNRQWCFTFQLDRPIWRDQDRYEYTRFRFSTVDMFEYGHTYHVELQSLPKPRNRTATAVENYIAQDMVTPGHPEPSSYQAEDSDHCTRQGVYPHASAWLPAFRHVYVHPKLSWIYVDFIAAPPHYCFEKYELRLINEKQHLVQQVQIEKDYLVHSVLGGVSITSANYTFHNVTTGRYDIGIVPIPFSKVDGRCLCPMPNRVCMCSMSVWPDVEMPDLPSIPLLINPCDYLPPAKLPFDCPQRVNRTVDQTYTNSADDGTNTALASLLSLTIGGLIILLLGTLILIFYYRRYKRKDIVPRMYLLPTSTTNTNTTMARTMDTEMTTLLIPIKLAIIYAHDCNQFDDVVQNLVDYLTNQCLCDVTVDYLHPTDIAENKFDWAYKSIMECDGVLLVNSYGAYMRYQAKLSNISQSIVLERAEPVQFDDLFMLQLDFLAQEYQKNTNKKFVSIRFPFTPDRFILPHANPHVRYELPKHFKSLMMDLHHLPIVELEDGIGDEMETLVSRQLKRVNADQYNQCSQGERLKESIEAMTKFIQENPNWFERLHVRRTLTSEGTLPSGLYQHSAADDALETTRGEHSKWTPTTRVSQFDQDDNQPMDEDRAQSKQNSPRQSAHRNGIVPSGTRRGGNEDGPLMA